jgi:putative redox protein
MHPKNFLSLDGADHLLSNKGDSSYAGKMIAYWIKEQIGSDHKKESMVEEDLEEGFVRSITSGEGFVTPIKTGKHHLLADEPTSVGGSDLGPSPYNLLASALASCTSMTVQMYARRKEWDLTEVTVEIKQEKKHKIDCENEAKIDHFYKRIHLEGKLDVKQRERLMEISKKCPVHRTLEGDIQIESELMD